jgi:hypothetical protein
LYSYNLAEKTFVLLKSDETARVPGHCIPVDESSAVATDCDGNVFGLSATDSEDNGSFRTTFCFNTGEVILSLRMGSMDQAVQQTMRSNGDFKFLNWVEPFDNDGDIPINGEVGNLANSHIYGCSVSGSIFAFYKISSSMYYKLKFLEELILQIPGCRPVLGDNEIIFDIVLWHCSNHYNIRKWSRKIQNGIQKAMHERY